MEQEKDLTCNQIHVLENLFRSYPNYKDEYIDFSAGELFNCDNIQLGEPESRSLKELNSLSEAHLITGIAYNIDYAHVRLTKLGKEVVEKLLHPHKGLIHTSFYDSSVVSFNQIDEILQFKNVYIDYDNSLKREWTLSDRVVRLLKKIGKKHSGTFYSNPTFIYLFDILHLLDNMKVIKGVQHNKDYINYRLTSLGNRFINLFVLPNCARNGGVTEKEISAFFIHSNDLDKKPTSTKIPKLRIPDDNWDKSDNSYFTALKRQIEKQNHNLAVEAKEESLEMDRCDVEDDADTLCHFEHAHVENPVY